jgi:hypothetical protein
MMVTKNQRNINTKHSNERVMVPAAGIGSSEGAGTSGSVGIDTNDKVDELAPVSTPHPPLNPNPTSSLTTTAPESLTMMMVRPESKNCAVAATVRPTERVPKPQVTKTSRSMKHRVRDPWLQIIGPAVSAPRENCYDAGHFSPLCVKKKMSRRTQMNNNKQKRSHRHSLNSNKKLPLTKEQKTYHLKEQPGNKKKIITNAKEEVICNNNNYHGCTFLPSMSTTSGGINRTVSNSAGKVGSAANSSFSVHHDTGSLHLNSTNVADDENGSRDYLKANESILFEDSPEFWDRFLLDTYHQLMSNTTDLPDFDPIPYPALARGIPVEPEKNQLCLNRSSNGSLSNITVEYGIGKGPVSSKMQEKNQLTAKTEFIPNLVNSCANNNFSESRSNIEVPVDTSVDEKNSTDPKNKVGPDSWQMDVINRMLFYLDSATDCPYSIYRMQFHGIVEHCSKLHLQGAFKCRHLPGAIFEQIVNAVGGSIFLSIYKAAKRLPYGRLNSDAAVSAEACSSSICAPPNLMQLAVGYGYCMAQSITFKGRKICPDLIETQGIRYAAEIGAQTVLNMSKETRLSFWRECILKDGDNK